MGIIQNGLPIQFGARYKNQGNTDKMTMASLASTDAGAVTALSASGGGGSSALTAAAGLASEGNAPGTVQAHLIDGLNKVAMAGSAKMVAENPQQASLMSLVLGMVSFSLTKAPSLYLKSRREDKVQDPKEAPEPQ